MDFRSEGTRKSVNLSTLFFFLLKVEQCDFLEENRSGAGNLSKQGFLPCSSNIKNRKRRTQNPSKSPQKTAFKDILSDISL